MGLFRTAPKICHTYSTMIKFGTVIPYLQKIQKYMTQLLISAYICILPWKSAIFVISRNTDTDCTLIVISNSNFFFESLKVVSINMVAILMMSAKLATLGLHKIKVF